MDDYEDPEKTLQPPPDLELELPKAGRRFNAFLADFTADRTTMLDVTYSPEWDPTRIRFMLQNSAGDGAWLNIDAVVARDLRDRLDSALEAYGRYAKTPDFDSVPLQAANHLVCGVPWPVCPSCLGQTLVSSEGIDQCRQCHLTSPTLDNLICRRAPTHVITDRAGNDPICVCASHAVLIRRQLVDSVVVPVSAVAKPAATLGEERSKKPADEGQS